MSVEDWMRQVKIYDGPCKHDNKVRKDLPYGTSFCPACGASKGPDGKWRYDPVGPGVPQTSRSAQESRDTSA